MDNSLSVESNSLIQNASISSPATFVQTGNA